MGGNHGQRVEVEAIVTTDQPVAAYGGIQVSEAVLQQLAEAIRSGSIPMLIGHDIRRPLDPTILEAKVRQRADGYKEVWIRFSVDADAWEEFERERDAAGAPGGFSYSASEHVAVVPAINTLSAASVTLEADAYHWSDQDLLAAAEDLRAVGSVNVGRRYQFGLEPIPIVVLTLGVIPILTGLLANAIYGGLEPFLRKGRRTTFQFHVEREGGNVVDARLETDNPEALRNAIDSFDRLVNPGQLYEWDENQQDWKPLRPNAERADPEGPAPCP